MDDYTKEDEKYKQIILDSERLINRAKTVIRDSEYKMKQFYEQAKNSGIDINGVLDKVNPEARSYIKRTETELFDSMKSAVGITASDESCLESKDIVESKPAIAPTKEGAPTKLKKQRRWI